MLIDRQISIEGTHLLDILLKDSPDILLAQQLIRIALHEKDRIRASSFRAMSKYITHLSSTSLTSSSSSSFPPNTLSPVGIAIGVNSTNINMSNGMSSSSNSNYALDENRRNNLEMIIRRYFITKNIIIYLSMINYFIN